MGKRPNAVSQYNSVDSCSFVIAPQSASGHHAAMQLLAQIANPAYLPRQVPYAAAGG